MKYNAVAENNARKMLDGVASGKPQEPVWVKSDGTVHPASEGCGLLEQIVAEFDFENPTPKDSN